MKIRALTGADAGWMTALHGQAFERAWSEADLAGYTQAGNIIALGTEGAGFCLARHAAGEAEILTIAVAQERRREGIGAALIAAVLKALQAGGTTAVFLEVSEENSAAIYAGRGFVPAGRRKGYYAGTDALILRRSLDGMDAAP